MRIVSLLAAAAFLGASAMPASASEVEQSEAGTIHRLSPKDAEAVKEAAAERNRNIRPAVGDLEVNDRSSPQVHGEVGFAVGTGGYTSIFGTAVMPLGDDAVAAISFERTDFGNRRYRYRR